MSAGRGVCMWGQHAVGARTQLPCYPDRQSTTPTRVRKGCVCSGAHVGRKSVLHKRHVFLKNPGTEQSQSPVKGQAWAGDSGSVLNCRPPRPEAAPPPRASLPLWGDTPGVGVLPCHPPPPPRPLPPVPVSGVGPVGWAAAATEGAGLVRGGCVGGVAREGESGGRPARRAVSLGGTCTCDGALHTPHPPRDQRHLEHP